MSKETCKDSTLDHGNYQKDREQVALA